MAIDSIFFIGPQGSGKGTQAKLLSERLGFFYWEMGGILRAMRTESTPLAKKVTETIDQGILLTDEVLLEVVKLKLSEIPAEKGVIFDGVPRRLGQAEFLLNTLNNLGRKNLVTFFVDLPKEESLKRLLLRAEKEHRADDTKEKIEFRLKQYQEDTVPVLDFLKNRTEFFEIDGNQEVSKVTLDINSKILQING